MSTHSARNLSWVHLGGRLRRWHVWKMMCPLGADWNTFLLSFHIVSLQPVCDLKEQFSVVA